MISRRWSAEVLPVEASGVPGRGGVGSGVGSGGGSGFCCLCRVGREAPVPLRLQRVCGFFAGPFWQWMHPGNGFWQSIAGCLALATFTLLCSGNSTPRFFSSRTWARGFLIRYCVSSTPARENLPLAMLAMFKARRMSDCSRCTRPLCLAIVADMLNIYKKLVAASNTEMRLWPRPYMLP